MSQQPLLYPNVSLYVGDLAPEVSEGILYEIFITVGELQLIKICRDDVTKRSLGYAYVNFVNPNDAERALHLLNHTIIKGRPCRIMWQQRNPSRRRQGKGNIYISNLHPSIKNKDLYDSFSQFGTISSCKVVLDDLTQESKGYGYVNFEKEEDAIKAIELVNGKDIRGKVIYTTLFVPRNERLKAIENSWTNVFFRNLPQSFEKEDAIRLFSNYGEVTSTIVKQKQFADEVKVFGFANFKHHKDAVTACDELNEKEVSGNTMFCARAQSKREREQVLKKEKDIKRRETFSQYSGRNLYVKHIDDGMSEEELKKIFGTYGNITSAKIMVDEHGQRKGFGFVCFETKEQARHALDELGRNKTIRGYSKPIYVALHEPKDVRKVKYAARATRRPNNGYGWPYSQQPFAPSPNQFVQPNQFNQGYYQQQQQQQQQPQQGFSQQASFNNQRQQTPPTANFVPRNFTDGLPSFDKVIKMSNEEKRDVLGRHLFYVINSIQPGPFTSKITGMLLEWDAKQIYDILSEEEMIKSAVSQAVELISQQSQ